MRIPASDYAYLFLTILLTVFGQVLLKWRVQSLDTSSTTLATKAGLILSLLQDPYVLLGFVSAFCAAIAWMITLTKFELSTAYPFMSLSFVLVLLLGGFLFDESITGTKIAGVMLIALGTAVSVSK